MGQNRPRVSTDFQRGGCSPAVYDLFYYYYSFRGPQHAYTCSNKEGKKKIIETHETPPIDDDPVCFAFPVSHN